MRKIFTLLIFILFLVTSVDATTWYFWRYRTHASDCTSITDGRAGDLCYEEDDKALYICETEDGLCDTASEWKRVYSDAFYTNRIGIDTSDSKGYIQISDKLVVVNTFTSDAINEAINTLGSEGGEVYLPEGQYTINSTITIDKDNVVLRGAGKATHLLGSGTAGSINTGILVTGNNVTIRDLWLDGNTNVINYGIVVKENSGCRVLNCIVSNMRIDGIVFGPNTTNGMIKGNYVYDCYNPDNVSDAVSGIELEDGAQQITVIGNIVENCYAAIYPHTHGGANSCKEITIVGNVLIDGSQGDASINIGHTDLIEDIIVKGNILHGGKIFAKAQLKNLIIEGNTVISSPNASIAGIQVEDFITGAVIRGNLISGSNSHGIAVTADRAIIEGNIIENSQKYGIYIGPEAEHCVIVNNTVRNNDQGDNWGYGIDVYGPYCIVANNQVYDDQTTPTQDYGIRVRDTADYSIILGNLTKGNASNKGIRIDDATGYFIGFNNIQEATPFNDQSSGNGLLIAIDNNNVGVGVTSPSYKLEVNGIIGSSPDGVVIADSGDANPASYTLTPSTSFVKLTCNDADGCNITMGETGMAGGATVTIVNVSANTCNFSDSAGVSELAGDFAMDQWDSLSLIYAGDRWVEVSRSDN